MEYSEFFARATGRDGAEPYDYQRRIALDGLPDVIEVPTGAGKTLAAAGGWLYRRFFHPDATVREATPRRLVYALPMRVLVESVTSELREVCQRLELDGDVAIVQLMGGGASGDVVSAWRQAMDRPSIVVGTVDQIVSGQLMRRYGTGRRTYPIDFALLTNGAHVVVDEIQLAGQATSTSRQLAAFQRRYATSEPVGLTCMSATIEPAYLDTVDHPYDPVASRVIQLSEQDERGPLATRLRGSRRVVELSQASTDADVATRAAELHRSGTLTLVIANRVDEAVAIRQTLQKRLKGADAPEVLLVHSRFRGVERERLNAELRSLTGERGRERLGGTPGCIVVATQAVEAGVDLDATTLITEVAPWPSLCQRAGRCNRAGLNGQGDATTASIHWFARSTSLPYDAADLTASVNALRSLEGATVTSRELLAAGPDVTPDPLTILRRPTFDQLFDTAADLSGGDIDVSRYIRSDNDRDVQLAWVDAFDGSKEERRFVLDSPDFTRPDARWRVSVSLSTVKEFLKQPRRPAVWIYDTFRRRWVRVGAVDVDRLRPQDLLLVDRDAGGYDPVLGFARTETSRVDPIDTDSNAGAGSARHLDGSSGTDNAADEAGTDPASFLDGEWQLLADHLAEARAAAEVLVNALGMAADGIDEGVRAAVLAAVHVHDLGKSFIGWQEGLKAAGAFEEAPTIIEGLLAKAPKPRDSAVRGRRLTVRATPLGQDRKPLDQCEMGGRPLLRRTFRHELVSVLLLRGRGGRLLLGRLGVPPERFALVDYLVAAHHGVLRVTPRDPGSDGRDGSSVLGVVDGEWIARVDLGELSVPGVTADLSLFRGGPGSWGTAVGALLDEFGPFRLAYLEAVVRMADWRASSSPALEWSAP